MTSNIFPIFVSTFKLIDMVNFNFVFNRVKNLILTPEKEWELIHSEAQTKNEVIKTYAIPLLIILVLSSIAGDMIFASRELFSPGYVISKALITFIIAFSTIYIASIIINELTVSFNSKQDSDVTFKLVVYSFTAYFLTAAFSNLLPPLGIIQVFALYSIYLFWLGCGPLLNTTQDNKIGFVVVSSLIILGIYAIISLILTKILTGIFVASQVLR